MKRKSSPVSEYVRRRLLERARSEGVDHQSLLVRYANERLLARVGRSAYGEQFVLKGAALFTIWSGTPHRATRDIDLLGFGDPSPMRLHATFTEILQADADDGVTFETETLVVEPIRHDQSYGGHRMMVTAWVGSARLRLQVDVGFGDAITPAPIDVAFPSLLDLESPRLRAYPPETVVAEKLEAAVRLGVVNSRMKDFYDLAVISRRFVFDGDLLVRSLRATFERRGTPFPEGEPAAWTPLFTRDPGKCAQWSGFVRKSGLVDAPTLDATVEEVRRFLGEPLRQAAGNHADWKVRWRWEDGWSFVEIPQQVDDRCG